MTEGPTLLPNIRSDKRTKEVFVLSFERIKGRSGRGLGAGMDEIDGALSVEMIVPALSVGMLPWTLRVLPTAQGSSPAQG